MTQSHPVLHFIFDGPPSHESGRFVEVETPDGHSINAGVWRERKDGLWELIVRFQPNAVEEDIVEQAARVIDPSSWRVFDGYLAEVKRKDIAYDPAAFKDKASMEKARQILAFAAPMMPQEKRA